ncbi:MAG: O-antigen ligase family protein [Patescibacteria group bacterium]|nr:O-antigen ligase family protein [Patescibacteria group bacterium]MDD4610914.1 O-antigen ligase family protein [Patescibacteria group bacterium]
MIYFIFYFLFCLWRLDWAVLFLIAALPSYLIRFNIFGIPSTVLEGMILISFAIWFFKFTEFKNFLRGKYGWKSYLENRKQRIKYPFGLEIVLVLIISFIAVAVAHFSTNALGIWKAYFFEPLLVYILILNIFGGAKNVETHRNASLRKIILALAVSAFVISAFAIFQKFTGAFISNPLWAAEATRRVTSFFPYPNAVGLYLGPLVLLFAGYLANLILNFKFLTLPTGRQVLNKFQISNFKFQNIFKVIFLATVIMLSVVSIYFAKSEGAMAGVVVGLIVFGLLAGKRARWATIGLILILTIGVSSYAPARNYFIEKATLNDLSGQIRKQQWIETKKMLYAGYWFWGTGLDNYEAAVKPFHQEGIFLKNNDPDWLQKIRESAAYRQMMWQPTEIYHYPHNILLNFWTELGLVGMLLFVWVVFRYLELGIRSHKLVELNSQFINIGLFCAMIAVIVHGLVDVPYFKNDLAVMFWVLVALIALINLKNKIVIDKNI